MMAYGGIRLGFGRGGNRTMGSLSMGDIVSDSLAAAQAASSGQAFTLPPGVALARVTTSDPAPSGDLLIRKAPSDSAAVVETGGAEKDGLVAVLDMNASADYAEVVWPGGPRRPFTTGFAHRRFLVIVDPASLQPPAAVAGTAAGDAVAAAAGSGMSTGAKVAIGVGVVAALGIGYAMLR